MMFIPPEDVPEFERDGQEFVTEGYATTDAYKHGEDYEWVCKTCFDDLHDALGFSVVE